MFEESTGFCRSNPPTPNEVIRDGRKQTIAKWPVIPFPERDYCGGFKAKKSAFSESRPDVQGELLLGSERVQPNNTQLLNG